MAGQLKTPQHIAIIMDGNGRWAQKKGFLRVKGHEIGGERVRGLVEVCNDLGVKYLTLYTFSTENWSRPKLEVNFLMDLLIRFLKDEIEELHQNNVIFKTIGHIEDLPPKVILQIEKSKELTQNNTGLTLTLALNYGSRREITDAMNSILALEKTGQRNGPVTESEIQSHLYTHNMPDPDLLIRTAGEMRISNYLLWQISYAEIVVTDTYFPEFNKEEFIKAIKEYSNRKRRFGGLVNR